MRVMACVQTQIQNIYTRKSFSFWNMMTNSRHKHKKTDENISISLFHFEYLKYIDTQYL